MKSPNDIENVPDLAALFGAIGKINHRLNKLEGIPTLIEIKSAHQASIN